MNRRRDWIYFYKKGAGVNKLPEISILYFVNRQHLV